MESELIGHFQYGETTFVHKLHSINDVSLQPTEASGKQKLNSSLKYAFFTFAMILR